MRLTTNTRSFVYRGTAVLLAMVLAGSLNEMALAVDLLVEDFEGLTLKPVVTFESEIRERNAWQTVGEDGPLDWTEINLTTSVGDAESGVLEFEGWRFVNKEWWMTTAGDQDRTQFLNGIGIIAVADPDEWDDFGNPDEGSEGDLLPENGVFDSTLITPSVSLGDIGQGDVVRLSFSSSWRPEDQQTATLTAAYDTGPAEELDLWTSVAADSNFKSDATNETLAYDLQAIPDGASSVQFQFRLQGNNDWWWAIDNLRVFTGDAPGEDGVLRTVIDRDTGEVKIVNNTGQSVELRGYSIRSYAGAFDEANATFLSSSDTDWVQATEIGGETNDLSELHLDSDSFNDGDEISLGEVWDGFFQELEDVTFHYLVEGSDEQIQGAIHFDGNEGLPYEVLDLNFDGDVDILDWNTFKDGFGTDLTGLTQAARYARGDLDNDSLHTLSDFTEFQRVYDQVNGAGTFSAMVAAVPEPATVVILAVAAATLSLFRRSRRLRSVAFAGIGLALLCGPVVDPVEAQLILLDEDFEGLPLGPFLEEGGGGGGNVWTNVPPSGWTTDNSDVPGVGDPTTDGVVDWANWAFVNKDAWIEAAGDQGRSDFTRGTGTVMVADPDEWDDADGGLRAPLAQASTPDDLYDVFATTHQVMIPAGIPAGRIKLSFDSSWFGNEFQDDLDGNNNQTATIQAIYDNRSPINVFRYESDPDSDDYHPVERNQRISELDLQYDGTSTSLQLEFALTEAWNDWWWAVDNVLISVPTDPAVLRINTATGEAFLAGDDVIPSAVTGINVISPSGSLRSISGGLSRSVGEAVDGPDSGDTPGDTPGERWELLASTNSQFAEAFLFGSSTFDNTRSEVLGRLVDPASLDSDPEIAAENSDIGFTYSLATGTIVDGVVEYFFEMPDHVTGDYNDNGVVEQADLDLVLLNWGEETPPVPDGWINDPPVGRIDQAELDGVLLNWGARSGGGSGLAGSSPVPEPSTLLLALLVAVFARYGSARRTVRGMVLLIALLLAPGIAQAQLPPSPFVDRLYQFGDDDANAAASSPVSQTDGAGNLVTFDSAGEPNQNQLIDLVVVPTPNIGSVPRYVSTADRPGGGDGLGIELNPQVFDRQFLHTGFGEALNFPEQSPSSLASVISPGGTLNYFRVNDRGFELWAKPAVVTGEHHIVMDSQQHGVLINDEGNFAMRYGSRFEVETTQLPGPDGELGTEDDVLEVSDPIVTPANYTTDVAAEENEWFHLSVVRPFGPSQGSIFYINGVAEAIAFGTYAVETVVNVGEGDVFTNIDSLDTSPLTVGRATDEQSIELPLAESHFFRGIVDDLKMFVMGLNDDDNVPGAPLNRLNDWGEYVFQRDNGYAQLFAPPVDGDLNGDGLVTAEDAALFASNWLFENRLSGVNPITGVASSRVVGDLSTRALGDFDYSGIIDLDDWAILNNANPAAGAAVLRMVAVPEPSTLVILSVAAFVGLTRSRRARLCCHRAAPWPVW